MKKTSFKTNMSLKSTTVLALLVFSFSFSNAQTIMYGMTSAGGSHSDGTIYKFDPSTNTETVVYSFAGGTTDGASPQHGSLAFDGNNNLFYGMTQSGGAYGDGTIFNFNIFNNTETMLYSFAGGTTDGSGPVHSLTYNSTSNLFYGTTPAGGSSANSGTVFSFNPNTNAETKLFAFSSYPLASTPQGALTYDATNGLYYGTTFYGGAHNYGTIFSFNTSGNAETTLWSFADGADAANPGYQLVPDPANGIYYCGSFGGGTGNTGAIFSYNPSTNAEAVPYSLQSGNGSGGRFIVAALVYNSTTGVFYGVTQGSTTQTLGIVFEFNPTNNAFTVIHEFTGGTHDGQEPQAGLTYNYSNGLYYGTTQLGGTYNKGTIYSVNPVTNVVTVVWSFGGTGDGQTPLGSVIQANPNCTLTVSGSTSSNIACNGNNVGSASVTASGGQTPYTYLWSDNNSQTTATATGLSAGTYTVLVHDLAGCEALAYVTITQPNPFTISMASHTNASCASPGTATAAFTNYTYTVNYSYESAVQHFTVPSGVTQITVTAAGGQGGGSPSWNVVGGDGASLTGICNVIPGDVISVVVGQKGGSSPEEFGNGGGGGSFVYDSNTNSLLVVAAGGGGAGWQTNGGAAGTNISTNATTNGYGADGTALGGTSGNGGSGGGNNISPGPGPGGAGWISNGGNSVDDANGDAPYANGNGGLDRVNHFKGGLANIGDTNCGGYGGGGSGGYDGGGGGGGYNGGGGGQDDDAAYNGNGGGGGGSYLNGTLSGTVTATDTGNGFVSIQYIGPGGVAPYTYSWSPNGGTNISASDLSAGSYTVTANDANGCTTTTSVTITGSSLSLSINYSNVLCNGGNSGNASATVSGGVTPYTYLWSNGATTSNASGLTAGTYSVSVYDNSGCYAADGITITQPTPFVLLGTNEAYLPITITNSQSSATPTNFQQMVKVNSLTYIEYEYSGLQNVEFTTGPNGTGSVLQAWIESGAIDTSASTTYWVNMGSNTIPANSSITIYLNFMRTTVMSASGPTGVAPQLYGGQYYATSYGQYDNGATIFPFYDNFAGTSLNPSNNWINSGITFTVNNGFTATHTNALGYILSKNIAINPSTNIVDFYGINTQTTGLNWIGTGAVAGGNTPTTTGYGYGSMIVGAEHGGNTTCGWQRNPSTTVLSSNMQTGTTPQIWTVVPISSSTSDFYINYGGLQTVSTGAYTYPLYEGLIAAGANGSAYSFTPNVSISWYRVRLYPPSNVMPTVALGSVISAIYVTSNVSCGGGNNGSLSALSPSGGTTPYTYTWSPGGGSKSTASNLSAGTYTLTINDANGCSASSTATITQPAMGVTITIASYTNATCIGGSATANAATGGASPYTYAWTPNGGSGLTASNLTANTYTITATDNKGCSGSASVTITQSTLIPIATVVSNVSCNGGNNGSAVSSASNGTSPYTYSWSDGNSTTTASISNLTFGTYTVTITDHNGCSAKDSVTISQPARLIYVSAGVISQIKCNGNSNGKATVTPVGGVSPYTYSWSNGTSTVSTLQTTPAILSAGIYTVTVHDSCGFSASATVSITQPKSVVGTITSTNNVGCSGGNGGSLTVTGSGGCYPYSYSWSTGSTLATATGLSAGVYSVILTDKNGCVSTTTVGTITQPVALYDSVHSLTYSSPCAGALGSVTIGVKGGTQPYTYTWTLGVSTTSNATALAARNYTVTVKDIHGCSSSVGFTINQVNAIRDSIVKTVTVNVSCFGANNGSATVGVKYGAAPYTYTWTPNVSSIATANGLSNGTYSVSVTDNNGCSGSTTSVIITQPQLLRDSLASSTDVGCYGGNGGSASIGTRGGTAPYTYLWSNGKTTYSISSLTYGTYTVSITDNHGCPNTVTGITITQPASPLTATIPTPICVGGGNGTITVNASGGTPGYTYLWSNGETNTTMTVVSATYTVKVSDVHGCNASSTVTFSCGPVVLNRRGEDDQRPADCCPSLTEVNLYPNPNMGQFTLSGLEQGMIVEIYDYTGRKINSRSVIHNSDLAINISDQSNGVYLIRILDKNGILVSQKKMVKTQ